MNEWFWIESSVLAAMQAAPTPSAEVVEAYFREASDAPNNRILSVSNGTARIEITGVLTARPSWMSRYYGGGNTTYAEIISAIEAADADSSVKEVQYFVQSGGGQFGGLFETLAVMNASRKPSSALVQGVVASAAYALVSQVGRIEAVNKAVQVGSIGVAATYRLDPNAVTVTSTAAPNKRPDPETEEGKQVIRKELDDLHAIFVDAIAAGRKVTVDRVNADFGMGGVVLSEEALKLGMIDAVSTGSSPRPAKTKSIKANMTPEKFKLEHPEAYAAIVGKGVEQERNRASAHLLMGKTYNAMDAATAAIEDGSELDALTTAKYLASGKASDAAGDRGAESSEADAGETSPTPAKQDMGDKVMAAMQANEEDFE